MLRRAGVLEPRPGLAQPGAAGDVPAQGWDGIRGVVWSLLTQTILHYEIRRGAEPSPGHLCLLNTREGF